MTKLQFNQADKSYILRHAPDILKQFELVVNTVSMEETVQLQVGQTETPAEQDQTPRLNAPAQVIYHCQPFSL